MNEAIAQASTSSERLNTELKCQLFWARRLRIMGLIIQTPPFRWWIARHSRPASASDLSKIPVYPGA